MFFAAIGRFTGGADEELNDGDGFAIVTSASDQGMVDIHDRMPVVFPTDIAREWLDTGLEPERAEDLARHHAEPVDAFEWYEVGKDVGNVKNKGADLIRAIATPTQPLL